MLNYIIFHHEGMGTFIFSQHQSLTEACILSCQTSQEQEKDIGESLDKLWLYGFVSNIGLALTLDWTGLGLCVPFGKICI